MIQLVEQITLDATIEEAIKIKKMHRKKQFKVIALLSFFFLVSCKDQDYTEKESMNGKSQTQKIEKIQAIEQNPEDGFNYKNLEMSLGDTIYLGSNVGNITKYKPIKKGDNHLLSIIIENEYEEGITEKDTFSNGTLQPWFGVYAMKTGPKIIKGVVMEEALTKKKENNDSILSIVRTFIHFSKPVYVLDSIHKN